jgi:hypothetical protein
MIFLHSYKNIHLNFVFSVNHVLRHKATLVASGNLTAPTQTDNKYSIVVSLHSMRIASAARDFVCLPRSFHPWKGACFFAGPEFGPHAGHLLIIVIGLYALRTCWHDCFADVMLCVFCLARQILMGGCVIASLTMNMSLVMLMTFCPLANSFLTNS